MSYYTLWISDGFCLDHLIASVAPLCNAITANFLTTDQDTASNCALDALEQCYKILHAKKVPCEPKRFTAYLNAAIRRVLAQSILNYQTEEFEYSVASKLPHARLPNQEDVIYAIHFEQVQRNAIDEAISRIRFRGDEYAVCCHALDWITKGTGIAPGFLARRYQMPEARVRWLFQYARVVYKIVYHEACATSVSGT